VVADIPNPIGERCPPPSQQVFLTNDQAQGMDVLEHQHTPKTGPHTGFRLKSTTQPLHRPICRLLHKNGLGTAGHRALILRHNDTATAALVDISIGMADCFRVNETFEIHWHFFSLILIQGWLDGCYRKLADEFKEHNFARRWTVGASLQ